MKRLYFLILISIIFLCNCKYNYERTESFTGYYDKEHLKIKMEGEMKNGIENGDWKYFDLNGSVIQQGNYKDGLLHGEWKYSYKALYDSLLYWKIFSIDNFKFSLTSNFCQFNANKQSSNLIFIDSITKDGFSIFSTKIIEGKDIEDYVFKNIDEYKETRCAIFSDSLKKITTDESSCFYIYNLDCKCDNNLDTASIFNIYTRIDDNLIVLVYTCKQNDFIKGQFLVGEIFLHSFFGSRKIFNSLSNIKEINTIQFK